MIKHGPAIFLTGLVLSLAVGADFSAVTVQEQALEILKAKSPDAYVLARKAVRNNYTVGPAIIKSNSFGEYLSRSKNPISFYASIATAVHESAHLYADIYAMEMIYMQETVIQDNADFVLLYINRKDSRLLVKQGLFSVTEIAASIPSDCRGLGYAYLFPDAGEKGRLAFTLLYLFDEYNAGYWGTKATLDISSLYLQEKVSTGLVSFLEEMEDQILVLAEIRLSILAYFAYAKKHYPLVYESMVKDEELAAAFTTMDTRLIKLINAYGKELSNMNEVLEGRQLKLEVSDRSYELVYPDSAQHSIYHNHRFYSRLVSTMNEKYLQYAYAFGVSRPFPRHYWSLLENE